MADRFRKWVDGLKNGEKMPKKNHLFLLLLVGLLLLVIGIPVPEENSSDAKEKNPKEYLPAQSLEYEDYGAYLEKKTEDALRYVEGVGRVRVMITLKSTSQKVVEKDRQSSSQTVEESDSNGGSRLSQERNSDSTSIYEQKNDGSSTPYVSKELTPEVEGVVVIADGGGNAVTVRNITEAVQALFGVEAHKIKIMKRADT